MNRFLFLFSVGLLAMITGCKNNENNEPESTGDIKPGAIYFDYQVRGEEGSDTATILLQFRNRTSYGGTLSLSEPSHVELDGELIPADSTSMTGKFYEIQKPIAQLSGNHHIVFTDADNKKHTEEFSFGAVILKTVLPDSLGRDELIFEFEGLKPLDSMRVILSDTTYPGQEIDMLNTVKNGLLIIKKKDIGSIVNGPVQVIFIQESEIPVKNGAGKEGGRLSFSYSIKREFNLVD